MSFLYRKIKQGPDAEWTVKNLDSITFEAVELSFENSSGTEVANIGTDGTLTALGTVQVIETAVDCSAGGTAQTAAIGTVPAGSVLLDIVGLTDTAFNGNTTKTFEVGITGNTDKYLDPADFAVTLNAQLDMYGGTNNDQKYPEYLAAATPIIATWTNTAAATAGQVTVRVIYVPIA